MQRVKYDDFFILRFRGEVIGSLIVTHLLLANMPHTRKQLITIPCQDYSRTSQTPSVTLLSGTQSPSNPSKLGRP